MKLGIGSYTLAWSIGVPGYDRPSEPLTAFGLLHIARRNGIRLVQIADNIPLHRMRDDELRKLKTTADHLDIDIEVGTRGTDPAHLLDYLRIAEILGARLLRTLITSPDLREPTEQLKQALPKFQAAGVRIAVENHGLHTTRQLVSLFDEIGSGDLGCCLDTVNSFSALDAPGTVIKDLAPYALNLHIKDFYITRADHQMGFMVLGKAAGYGKLNIPAVMEAVRGAGRDPTAILELWTPFASSVETTVQLERQWMTESLDYLRQLPFE